MCFQIMLYGQAGTGITRIAEKAPDPVVIQTTDVCDCGGTRYDVSKNMRLNDAINAIVSSSEFKTIVINNMTGLERLIFDFEFGRNINPYEQGFGVGEGRLKIRFRQVLDKIRESGKNLVILADAVSVNMPGVFSSNPIPCLMPNANRCLMPLIQDALQAVIPVVLVESADGRTERRIVLRARPSVMAYVQENLREPSDDYLSCDGSLLFGKFIDAD